MGADVSGEQRSQKLDTWVERLNSQEVPILLRTAKRIGSIAEKDSSDFAQMARAILEDALVTSRILKVANSAYYMTGRSTESYSSGSLSVNTITRAVMLLGFDTLRTLCESMALVEVLLKGIKRNRLGEELASAFHAAVQARWLAVGRKDKFPEEVFIATLLHNLGNMVFWCFADEEQVQRMEAALRTPGYSATRAEMEVLGFPLHQLTVRLGREWRLGGLLEDALDESKPRSSRVENIVLGHKLAQSVKQGWDTQEVKELTEKMAMLLALPGEKVANRIHANAKEAVQAAANWGALAAGQLIPLPGGSRLESVISAVEEKEPPLEEPRFFEPDPVLQLRILHDLSTLLVEGKPDYNLFISAVIEGIFRGIGMDRVLFALLSTDRRSLEVKYALGWPPKEEVQGLILGASPLQPNLFSHILTNHQPLWVQADPEEKIAKLLTPEVLRITNGDSFFIMPIVVRGKAIGLIYADRHPSGRGIDEDSFASFQQFCQQADIGLSFASRTT